MLLAANIDLLSLVRALPGNVAQGLIWGILAIGVYMTFRLLDFADLTVDGSFATGGAVAVMLIRAGVNPWIAIGAAFLIGALSGMVTEFRLLQPENALSPISVIPSRIITFLTASL